jgi:hypothetical protein
MSGPIAFGPVARQEHPGFWHGEGKLLDRHWRESKSEGMRERENDRAQVSFQKQDTLFEVMLSVPISSN